jgi:hypothetical protein
MAASKYIKTHLKHRERKQRLYIEEDLAKLSGRPTWKCHNTDDANDEGEHTFKCASACANHRVISSLFITIHMLIAQIHKYSGRLL